MAQISHREQLLQGAVECLWQKGYARTTARDIATAADANLASIGYHFGSKEALLNEAILRTCDQWTERLGAAAFSGGDSSPLGQMAATWVAMRDSFEDLGPVLVGLIEAVAQAARSDDLRENLAAHYLASRERVAAMVRHSLGENLQEDGIDPHVIASFLIAVCDGLIVQWLLDPEQTPSGERLASSLGAALTRAIARASPES
jgi:AcrR family transcriptional regulator